jgi:ferrous iron transport protein B
VNRRKTSDSIDLLLTSRFLGFPVFLLFMWLMFSATFNLGSYPKNWIEKGVGLLAGVLDHFMAEGSLKQLLQEGIIGGVGGVIVFLPNILILFFFISLMEDTGYMARAAFITDKLMHRIGLHGKSFIPMIMGFGCNVPAIMATRTIENRNNGCLLCSSIRL